MVVWKDDHSVSACESCGRVFNFFYRRHHCRHCGGIFCGDCSSQRAALGEDPTPQRVCRLCHQRLAVPSLTEIGGDGRGASAAGSTAIPTARQIKVCILGAPNVGKTSIILQLIEKRFNAEYRPSVLTIYRHEMMSAPRPAQPVRLELQDAGGVSACDLFQPQYTIGVHAFVVVYAVDDVSSFAAAKSIRERLLECGCGGVPTVVVANKCDIAGSKRVVSAREGKDLAEAWGALWMEVSATNHATVERLFTRLVTELMRREQ